jgi:hypothetical protein
MGTKRRDRTGDEYGIFTVTGPDQVSPHLWGGIWGCCGRYQAITIERCTALSRQLPKRCIRCVRTHDGDPNSYEERERERMRQKRAAAKLAENRPEERHDHEGVTVPGWGFVPAMAGDFGRLNASGHETQGWRRTYEWADDA